MGSFPVILFAYNRPEHLRRTVESLLANRRSAATDLHIFSDGPKTPEQAVAVGKVRDYLRTIAGFRSVRIVERERNMGLAASVIAGTSEILGRHDACIVMEDDMLAAPSFLDFMNVALETYRDRQDVFSVTGYNYPLPIAPNYPEDAYLSYRGSSWGWGSWADRWCKVDWEMRDYPHFAASAEARGRFARGGEDLPGMLKLQMEGKIDSWSIRFDYAHCKHEAFCLHPVKSKIQNIGFDGSGVHCGASEDYRVDLDSGERDFRLRPDLRPDPAIIQMVSDRFRPQRRSVGTLIRAARKAQRWTRDKLRGKGAIDDERFHPRI